MEDKKDIGRAFREKLNTLDRQPGDTVWDAINKDLDRKRRGGIFWRWAIPALLLAVCCSVFALWQWQDSGNGKTPGGKVEKSTSNAIETIKNSTEGKDNSTQENVSGTEKDDRQNVTQTVIAFEENESKAGELNSTDKPNTSQKTTGAGIAKLRNENKTDFSSNGNNSATTYRRNISGNIQQTTSKSQRATDAKASPVDRQAAARITASLNISTGNNNHGKPGSAQDVNATTENGEAGSLTAATGSDSQSGKGLSELPEATADSLKTEIKRDLVLEDDKKEEEQKDKKDSIAQGGKRFFVFAHAGTSTFNFQNNEAKVDSAKTAPVRTDNSFSYGISLGYNLNERWSVRAGINLFRLKQAVDKVRLQSNTELPDPDNPEQNIFAPNFPWISYEPGIDNEIISQALSGPGPDNHITFTRSLEYLEIPAEVTYRAIGDRFGLNVTAGGSLLLLTNNRVEAIGPLGSMRVGSLNTTADTSFSAGLGLSLYYRFMPALQINVEPQFKYYFNAFSDGNPYSFGIRAGLQYNFDLFSKK